MINFREDAETLLGRIKVVHARGHAMAGEIPVNDGRVDLKADIGAPHLNL